MVHKTRLAILFACFLSMSGCSTFSSEFQEASAGEKALIIGLEILAWGLAFEVFDGIADLGEGSDARGPCDHHLDYPNRNDRAYLDCLEVEERIGNM